jgi:hypothetical protein
LGLSGDIGRPPGPLSNSGSATISAIFGHQKKVARQLHEELKVALDGALTNALEKCLGTPFVID